MTTTALAIAEDGALAIADALIRLRTLSDPDELQNIRANIEAARAWAKVHGKLKEARLKLLRVEIAALARIIALGHSDILPKKDRSAAEHFATLSDGEMDELVRTAGVNVTTAVGLYGTLQRIAGLEEQVRFKVERGRSFAESPDLEDRIYAANPVGVAAAIHDAIETHTQAGVAFTVEDFADDVIESAGVERDVADPAITQGVREVCRAAIRRAPVLTLGDTILPRTVTARVDETYVRIPTENALLAQLDDMVAMRQEQIAQDQAALDRLIEVAARLRTMPGASDQSRIGALIAASLMSAAS